MAVDEGVRDQAPDDGFRESADFFNPPDPATFKGNTKAWFNRVHNAYLEGLGRIADVEAAGGNEQFAQAARSFIEGNAAASPGTIRQIDPELASEILRPTDRPDEPFTTGLPFGPGANTLRLPNETDDRYRARIAGSLLRAGFATGAVVTFARRLAEGA